MHASDAVLSADTLPTSESERARERAARLRRLNTRTVPLLRLAGGNLLVLAVILHNALIRGAVDWSSIIAYLAVIEVYTLASWWVLVRWYDPDRRPDLALVFLVLDLLPWALAVGLTGGPTSWIFWIFLFRVVDQTSTHFSRAMAFTILGTLAYLGVILWFVAGGAEVSWTEQSAKLVFLLLGGTYMSLTARTAERMRAQLGQAIRTARQSVEELQSQSVELERAREQAEAGSRAKSAFLSRVSHELRTPMNAILGFAQLLEMERDLSGDQRAYVGEIMEGGRHLLDVINEVMDIARVETGSLAQEVEPVALDRALDEVLERALPAAKRRSVTLPSSAPPEARVWVAGTPRKVRQVFANLVSNAIKYNSSPGHVEIDVRADDGHVRVSVTDTGPGIPADRVEQAFVPFDRLGAERHEAEGTGLGLALSRSLVEAMGGRIGVDTEVGRGSTFWFELVRTMEPVEDTAEAASDGTDRGDSLVLYIDDKPENVLLVRRILARREGVELATAALGAEGIEAARTRQPDLILLDLELPDISGVEVLGKLRDDPETNRIPVVVVSAEASRASVDRLLGEGARAYFTMPYDVVSFLETLDGILGIRPVTTAPPDPS